MPASDEEHKEWIQAKEHIKFLKDNAQSSEIVIHATQEYSFIHSMVVPEKLLEPLDKEDLMHWQIDAFAPSADYVFGIFWVILLEECWLSVDIICMKFCFH